MNHVLDDGSLPVVDGVASADVSRLLRDLPRRTVPIGMLSESRSPRAQVEDPAHVRVLVESDERFEPLLVQRSTMRVIDGRHRLRAASLRGDTDIEVRCFDGDEDDAFVLAVRLNVHHGLPLTLSERKSAATRIVASYPHWSDRTVARCTGLSAKTVGKLRRQLTEEIPQLAARLGRDGKVRPLSPLDGRRRVVNQLREAPGTPLRELAERAGVSVSTVRDVRDRLRRGESPFPGGRQRTESSWGEHPESVVSGDDGRVPAAERARSRDATCRCEHDSQGVLRKLTQDPAFRGSETGRQLLRMLIATELDLDQWCTIIENVPSHGAPWVRAIAARRVEEWKRLADLRPPMEIAARRTR